MTDTLWVLIWILFGGVVGYLIGYGHGFVKAGMKWVAFVSDEKASNKVIQDLREGLGGANK